ncbi:MAG: hypothetical protein CVU29_08325 [Betaproteobacteria bacterium HGW-Betaproteobacteria-22]|nr:MAG: hypothetical protein CVU29_08325 [Betaproteobacteria bacterium HGW-Betaproteobacteria-22]
MDLNTAWSSAISNVGGSFPQWLSAAAILFIGWILAVIVRAAARRGLGLLKLNEKIYGLTGQKLHLENIFAIILFWIVLLLTLIAVFSSLNLGTVSGPVSELTNQVFAFAPRLFAGLFLALAAWLLASVVRISANKALGATTLDEKLSEHAGMAPISQSLGNAMYWIIILLFVPAILGALEMQGLLDPLRDMVTKSLEIVPNVFAAVVIGGVGWIIATVLRSLSVNLLRSFGADNFITQSGTTKNMHLSEIAGILVFLVVFVPSLIAALDALKIEAISKPATDMLGMLMSSVPHIIAAALILIVTWIVASFAAKFLASLLETIGFNTIPNHIGLKYAFKNTSASAVAGKIALFFAMLFASVEAANQLGFYQVSEIVSTFINFGGSVALGSAILVIGFWLANVAYNAIDRASGANSKGLASLARYAILALVIAMGLRAMGIADDIVNLAFGLTLGAIAVAVALSFGLGGREAAGKLMDHWLSHLINKK